MKMKFKKRPLSYLAMSSLLCAITFSPITLAKMKKEMPIPVVSTVEVEAQPVTRTLSLIGNLKSDKAVSITSKVAGIIANIDVKAGENIKKGAKLVTLDNAKQKANFDEAKAVYLEANRKLGEFKKLHERGALTKTELDAQASAATVAKAQLAAAQADLDEHVLVAPFAGTVGLIDIAIGQHITAGETLLNLDDLSLMQLDVNVPEQYLSDLNKPLTITARSKSYPGKIFEGTLLGVDSRVNNESLNIRARIGLDNKKGLLRSGMMMEANITFEPQVSMVIPVQAIEYSGTKRFVYLLGDKDIVQRTEIKLGARLDNKVTVEEGLSLGQRIVSQGLVSIRDGIKVKDIEQSDSEGK